MKKRESLKIKSKFHAKRHTLALFKLSSFQNSKGLRLALFTNILVEHRPPCGYPSPPYLHTASDQILEVGMAWEWGYADSTMQMIVYLMQIIVTHIGTGRNYNSFFRRNTYMLRICVEGLIITILPPIVHQSKELCQCTVEHLLPNFLHIFRTSQVDMKSVL